MNTCNSMDFCAMLSILGPCSSASLAAVASLISDHSWDWLPKQITFIAPRNVCWGSQTFLFSLTFMFPQCPFPTSSEIGCSVIWNVLSDNVINRVETCLKTPWELCLIFIKGVITLGAARLLSLSFLLIVSLSCTG